MMLRKRTRSNQKDQNMGHLTSDSVSDTNFQSNVLVQKHKANSFFHVPGLFVGFSPKISDSDSVRSPTSPLDFRAFSNLGSPLRSPRTPHEGHQKSWDSNKVGLSIIDSLDNDDTKQCDKVLRSSASKNILFGPQMRIKTPNFGNHFDSFELPKSLPKDYAISPSTHIKQSNLQKGNSNFLSGIGKAPEYPEPFGKILSCSLDSGRSGSRLTSLTNLNANSSSGSFCSENGKKFVNLPSRFMGSENFDQISVIGLNSIPISTTSENGILGSLSASEIELSEDYTCVRTHGPNAKTTHIFGDCILECHKNDPTNFSKKEEKDIVFPSAEEFRCFEVPSSLPSHHFLSFCYSCKQKLEGEDIYMYRGEKAFCSWTCREDQILVEETMEKKAIQNSPQNSTKLNNCEELFESCMFIAS